MNDNSTTAQEAQRVGQTLLAYCQRNQWAGYDPYDALNSRLLDSLPLLNSRLPRLALTQFLKRSPVNVRSLLQVTKKQNPKALALFLSALLKAPQLCPNEPDQVVHQLAERLQVLRSPDISYWCWGYSFPWQTRTDIVPRWSPNLVCTSFASAAFLDMYDRNADSRYLNVAVSGAEYILDHLYWTRGTIAGFSYPLPTVRNQVHNANLLAAALLARVYLHTSDTRFLSSALAAARYSAAQQRADGSWAYGEAPSQQWIDNFHTGYNLCALRQINESLRSDEFDPVIARGFLFFKENFLREDGAVRYFHNRTYPIDIHCVAQSIITLIVLRDLDRNSVALASRVFSWAAKSMWSDHDGFFAYRKLRAGTIRIPYMRWSQAWMVMAIAVLIDALQATPDPLGISFQSLGAEVQSC